MGGGVAVSLSKRVKVTSQQLRRGMCQKTFLGVGGWMRVDEGCWGLMRVDEGCWGLMRFDEGCWGLMRVNEG